MPKTQKPSERSTKPVSTATDTNVDSLLHQAKQDLRKGELNRAIEALDSVLLREQNHQEALYFLAVCQRKQQSYDNALECLKRLADAYPEYGRAYQEYGHTYAELNQHQKAVENFAIAVTHNPYLIASWRFLASHFAANKNALKADEANRHVQHLSSLPPELVSVNSFIADNKIHMAEQLCRQYLQKHKHHPEAMRLLAEIGSRLQILDDAEFLLEKCVEFYPEFHHARSDYVQVLHKRQKFEKALIEAKVLYAADKNNPVFELSLASCYQAVGRFDEALETYDRILLRDQSNPSVYAARGHALKTVGKTEQAISSYRQAYELVPSYGDAYWSLANLKTYSFTESEITQMREQQLLRSTTTDDKIHLCFALGKALEDQMQYAESFDFYKLGNQLKQDSSKYSTDILIAEFDEQKSLFTREFFEQRQGFGCDSIAPIFIVGLPRAGSTLLEQILASHSKVDGTMELANVIGLANRLGGRATIHKQAQYPSILENLAADDFNKFGRDFISDTQIHRQSGVFFIDKMPNNFRHIALIHLMLPNAKIIDARREPMACCFSGFKQLFAEGQEFTYGLDSIGAYYEAYVDLMNHWDNVLPNRILRVHHEDVIDDLDGQVRRILKHCGLDFEQSCVDFHKTERAVRTPSSEQVRQPIYKSSVQQWQNYESYLEPLITSLGDARSSYRE